MINVDKNRAGVIAASGIAAASAGVGIGSKIAANEAKKMLKSIPSSTDDYVTKAIERNLENLDKLGLSAGKRQKAIARIVEKARADFPVLLEKTEKAIHSKSVKIMAGLAAAGLAIGVGVASLITKTKKPNK